MSSLRRTGDQKRHQLNRPSASIVSSLKGSLGSIGLYGITSITLGTASMALLLAFSVRATSPYVLGESLVLTEVPVLPGLKMKPITLFTYLFFLSYAFGLYSRASRERFMKMRQEALDVLYVLAWFMAMLTGFEVLYHIVLWSASLSLQGLQNPDTVVNWWPRNPYPFNIVFASKLVVLFFSASCFTIDYLRRIKKERSMLTER